MAKTNRLPPIGTVDDALDLLGGEEAVASWLRIPVDQVASWREHREIPRGYAMHFYLTVASRDREPLPTLFGLRTFDPLVMPVSVHAGR